MTDKNPADLTDRNLGPLRARLDKLEKWVKAVIAREKAIVELEVELKRTRHPVPDCE